MSFTHQQISLLRSSWQQIIKGGKKEVGLAILRRLLAEDPTLHSLFHHLIPLDVTISLENLRRNKAISIHALKIIASFCEIMDLLDHPHLLRDYLQRLGEVHKRRNVPLAAFDTMGTAFLSVIETALAVNATEEVMDTWKAAYRFIKDGIVSAM